MFVPAIACMWGRHVTTLVIPFFGGDKRTQEADIFTPSVRGCPWCPPGGPAASEFTQPAK
jgi:hypothetical protein